MPNVFISHSWQDKPFVRKLAVSLLSEGLPVWLDSWEMAAGDSLINGVYDGIDESSAVVLVMSGSSIASGWVDRELNAALAKEDSMGRRFLIPIKIEECDVPLKVADRVFVDFSQHGTFSRPLTELSEQLVKRGLRDLKVVPERELIGLNFTQGVHLDTSALSNALSHVKMRQGDSYSVTPDRIVINVEREYEGLKNTLHANIDQVGSRDDYSPALESGLRDALEAVKGYENDLKRGLALLLQNTWNKEAWYWFAKIKRVQAVSTLYAYQLADQDEISEFGKKWRGMDLISNTSAARFFEVENVRTMNMWRTETGPVKHFSFWMDRALCDEMMVEGAYAGPQPYYECFNGFASGKFVLPQMINEFLRSGDAVPDPIWNLEEATIGIS